MGSRRSAPIYAVVRYDRFLGPDAPIEAKVTVKAILPNLDDAERQTRRLNELVEDDAVVYFYQPTRWFREGASLQ